MGVIRLIALIAALSSCAGCDKREEPRGLLGGGLSHQLGGPDEKIVRSSTATRTYNNVIWQRFTISASATGGADGVDYKDIDGDGKPDVVVPLEQGGSVTVSINPGLASIQSPWTTYTVCGTCSATEDAKAADLDGDGKMDVVSTQDAASGRIFVSFQNTISSWTTITLTDSLGHNHWMQAAFADIDGDGLKDIVAGGRVGTAANPAEVAWFKNPGTASARTAGAWVHNFMTRAGWIMSVIPLDVDGDGDIDVVVSDRTSYKDASNVTQFDLYGARWIENQSAGTVWVNHQTQVSGNESDPTKTPGDEKFLALYDWDGDGDLDIVDGTSATGHVNRVVIHPNTGWFASAPWANNYVTSSEVNTSFGEYEALAICDIDGDGLQDLVLSSTEGSAGAYTPGSTIIWVRNLGSGNFAREEMLGPAGSKSDNIVCVDVDGDGHPDVIANEQLGYTDNVGNTNQLGTFWLKNPYPSF